MLSGSLPFFVLVSFGLVCFFVFVFFFLFYFPFRENQARSLYSETALYAQLCSLAIIKTIKFSLPLDFNSSRFVALKKKRKEFPLLLFVVLIVCLHLLVRVC